MTKDIAQHTIPAQLKMTSMFTWVLNKTIQVNYQNVWYVHCSLKGVTFSMKGSLQHNSASPLAFQFLHCNTKLNMHNANIFLIPDVCVQNYIE